MMTALAKEVVQTAITQESEPLTAVLQESEPQIAITKESYKQL